MAKRSGGLRFQPAGGERKTQVPVGKKQKLKIERLANDGRGIAFVEGRSWFVSGALAGEEVEARVLAARAQVVEARCERVLSASGQRQAPSCQYFGRCGGCTLQHLPHAEQLALKQRALAEQLQRVANVQPQQWAEPLTAAEFGYRRRARIAVRWDVKTKQLAVGFRAEASQQIIAIDHCPVLTAPLQPLFEGLPALLQGLSKPQAIGHVELFHGRESALLLRYTAKLSDSDLAAVRQFCATHQAQLWLQGEGGPQADVADLPLGYELEPWQLYLHYQPGDFVQVNAHVNQAMVAQALQWLAPKADERVLDLYCGLGNFALPLARSASEVVAVEGVQTMVERAQDNAKNNALDNVHFFRADLSESLSEAPWAGQGFDAVLLDPPRDGAFAVVREIAKLGAQRVVYVSCNPATLARDTAELMAQGYVLTRAGVLDMFPQTAHVEAMALFERHSA